MDGVLMAPNARLKSRLRSSARSSKKLVDRNNAINHKNNKTGPSRSNSVRNNANQRHLNNMNINNKNFAAQAADVANHNNGNLGEAQEGFACSGDFTREVYNAVCPRLGHTLHIIPEDSVQSLFNDMHLYPSKSQVSEMLQCARQCGRRNGASRYMTFGEFCVFVREMQNQNLKQLRKIQNHKSNSKCAANCEVFLGGSCNPTTWRADTAIPELQKHGITFYNPQVSMWAPELVALEHDAKQSALVLLFVVDSETRSTGGMIEVAYLVSSGRCVVLVAHPYRTGQTIMGETVTQREYEDLDEGQKALLMLVRSRGIKVHSSLSSAIQCTVNILRNSTNNGMTAEEHLTAKLRKLREVFDSYGGQDGEIKFCHVLDAFEKLTHRELKIAELYEYLSSSNNEINVANSSISFERFCMLMAEFTTDHCDNMMRMCTTDDVWASQPFQRQFSANNNSCDTTTCSNGVVPDDPPFSNNSFNAANNRPRPSYDVFLGGPRKSQVQWRRDVAIPLLKKHGVTYYNPAVREGGTDSSYDDPVDDHNNSTIVGSTNNVHNGSCVDENVLEWKQMMDRSKVLLFVMTNDSRSLTTMILAAHYIGLGKSVVLSVQQLPEEDCVVGSEMLSKQAIKDYNRGRVYLTDLARRKQIPVFESITEAVQRAVDLCQNSR